MMLFKKFFVYFKLYLLVLFILFSTCLAQSPELEEKIAKDSTTEINVKNADIEALVRIFSKKTKRNYILDERVKGTVSIYLPGKVSSEEAIYILDSVLALKGFTAVPIGENIWKIIPSQEAKQTTVPIVGESEGRGTASVVTRFINLKYVSAEDVKQLIASLISSYGLISAYTGTNSLIMIDSEDNIKRLVKIIEYLDIPSSDSEMVIIPIEHANAIEVAEKLNEILKNDSDKTSAASNIPNTGQDSKTINRRQARLDQNLANANASLSPTSLTVAMRTRDPKIIADERTNSLIIVADEETTARIQALVDQLDSKIDLSGNQFFVYRCQHANATELAEVLSSLVSGDITGGSSQRTTASNRNENSLSRLGSQARTPGRSRTDSQNSDAGGTNRSTSPTSVSFGDNLSITADPSTNSLIIIGSKTEYEKVKELLNKLDIKRRQVIVEALILEVGMDENLSSGIDFNTGTGGRDGGIFASNNFDNLASVFASPQNLQDFSLAVASSGSLTLPGGLTVPSHSLLLQAVQGNSNVNVLSSPTILATDNEDAEIVVGQNVPFLASTASNQTDLGNVFNQVDRQDVGITLRITPQISSSDFVKLKLFTEVSNVIDGTADSSLGPTTTIRTSDTTVITKDSQMIVIGGLMSDNVTASESGVPFLKDIPIIGTIFKSSNERTRRTNLLIFITPRIVKDQFDARDVTYKHKDNFKEVLDVYEIEPDRYQELNQEELDNVIDGTIYEGKKPGTVRSNKKIDDSKINQIDITNKEDLSLNLGDISQKTEDSSKVKDENLLNLGKFVVFETRSSLPSKLPYFITDSSRLVGVYVEPEVSTKVKDYFQVGRTYSYTYENDPISMQVVGIFYTEQEARSFYKDLKTDWHRLTPYEILNLGKGPWSN